MQLKDKSFKPTCAQGLRLAARDPANPAHGDLAGYAATACRFQTTFDSKPYTDRQGINFAGRVFIKHNYAQAVMVPVPGKLTYDPGGRTVSSLLPA